MCGMPSPTRPKYSGHRMKCTNTAIRATRKKGGLVAEGGSPTPSIIEPIKLELKGKSSRQRWITHQLQNLSTSTLWSRKLFKFAAHKPRHDSEIKTTIDRNLRSLYFR